MRQFPDSVRTGMLQTGAAVTCVPVRLDDHDWETGIFIHLAGAECENDLRVLASADQPLPVTIETDLLARAEGAVAVLRFEVETVPGDPLAAEVLLTPGGNTGHFEALDLLARQRRLCWFFADERFSVVHSQQHPLDAEHHEDFANLLRDAVAHDQLVRMTGSYDARAALSSVVSHYELRASKQSRERAPGRDAPPPARQQ